MTLPRYCEYHGVTNGKHWEVLRIIDLTNPPQNWISSNGCLFDLGMGGGNGGINPNGTEMAATPLLSFPQDILTLDPVWASLKCMPDGIGFGLWDPPRTLTPATALGPAITTLSPHSKISNLDPAPASTPASMPVLKTTSLASPVIAQSSPTLKPIQALPTTMKSFSGNDPVADPSPVEVPDSKSSYHQSNSVAVPQVIATVDGKPVYTTPSIIISSHGPIDQNGDPAGSVEHTAISVDSGSIFAGTFSYHITSLNEGNEQAPKTVAGKALSAALSGAMVLDGNTIEPGQQTTIDGTYMSVGPHHLIIDGKTYANPSAASLDDPLPRIGAQSIESGPQGVIIVGSSTIISGQHTVIGSDSISLASGNVVVNGKTYVVPASSSSMLSDSPSSNPPTVIGGAVLKGNDDGGIFLGDSLIAPGHHTDIHGTRVSVGSDYMVIGSTTYSKPTAEPTALLDAYSALASIDPAVTIAKDGAIVMSDSTISVGQQATVNSVYISAGSDSLVVGSSTYKLSASSSMAAEKAQPTLTAFAGSGDISINPNGVIMMGDSSLTPGFQTTISGELVSIASDEFVIGGSTYALSDGPTISTAPNGDIVIGNYTLSKDESTIISGDIVEVNPSNVVIAGTTYPYPQSTSAEALGWIIASMFGYVESSTSGGSYSSVSEAGPTSRPFVGISNTSDSIANLSSFVGAQTRLIAERSLMICTMVLCICFGAIDFGL